MFLEMIQDQEIGEQVQVKKLHNGLTVFVMPKKGYTRQFASFTTHFGSNDLYFKARPQESFSQVPLGIAHFLEHKIFEEEQGNAFDRFVPYGASVNAFTNFNHTAYYFTTTSDFQPCLEQLIDFVQTPYFTDENVEKEKGIIAQEINMYRDQPQWQGFFQFLRGMYHQHPVQNDIAGTVESIHTITKEELYRCYDVFYHPSNMVLYTAGELEPEAVFQQVEAYFAKKPASARSIIRKPVTEPESIREALRTQDMSLNIPLFNLGYKDQGVPEGGGAMLKKEAVLRLLMDLLLGSSSTLYQSLYEKGYLNSSFQYDCVVEANYGYSLISGESDQPEKVQATLLQEVERLKREGIENQDFHRVRKKQIGGYLAAFNSLEYVGNSFVTYYLNRCNFLAYLSVLKQITMADLDQGLREHFRQDRQVLSVIQ